MFVVLGATGNTGSVVADRLLGAGKKVRVLVRDAGKAAALKARGAEVVTGSLESAADVKAAFAGAEGAYVLMPPDVKSDDLLGRAKKITAAIAEAVRAHRTPHVVLLSSVGADVPSGTGPIVTVHHAEEVLGAIDGTRLTAIRAAYFMENLLGMLHPMKADGVLPALSAGTSYAFPMIASGDIGEAAANALLSPPTESQIIELSAKDPISFDDAAKAFGDALGRPVKAVSVPYAGIVPALTAVGMSAHMAGLYAEMAQAFDEGRAHFHGNQVTVHGATDLRTFVKRALA